MAASERRTFVRTYEVGGDFAKIDQSTACELTSGEEVAVKLEHHKIDQTLLRDKFEIHELLAGGEGIPKVYWFGWESEYRAMVFEILCPSLEDLQLLRPCSLVQDGVNAGRSVHCPIIIYSFQEYSSSTGFLYWATKI
jgi:hypothetical protein